LRDCRSGLASSQYASMILILSIHACALLEQKMVSKMAAIALRGVRAPLRI
jgi:hypothetical protein